MVSIQARRVETVKDLEKPGDICFWHLSEDGQTGFMAFKCPCGTDVHSHEPDSIPVHLASITDERAKNSWLWDGNQDAPTLSPSIQRTEGCMWHGFLQNGVWHT